MTKKQIDSLRNFKINPVIIIDSNNIIWVPKELLKPSHMRKVRLGTVKDGAPIKQGETSQHVYWKVVMKDKKSVTITSTKSNLSRCLPRSTWVFVDYN